MARPRKEETASLLAKASVRWPALLPPLITLTKDGNAKARQMFEKVHRAGSEVCIGIATLGWNYYLGNVLLLSPHPNGLKLAFHMGNRQLLPMIRCPPPAPLAGIYMSRGQSDQAPSRLNAILLSMRTPLWAICGWLT
jgi:hypothetical protein